MDAVVAAAVATADAAARVRHSLAASAANGFGQPAAAAAAPAACATLATTLYAHAVQGAEGRHDGGAEEPDARGDRHEDNGGRGGGGDHDRNRRAGASAPPAVALHAMTIRAGPAAGSALLLSVLSWPRLPQLQSSGGARARDNSSDGAAAAPPLLFFVAPSGTHPMAMVDEFDALDRSGAWVGGVVLLSGAQFCTCTCGCFLGG